MRPTAIAAVASFIVVLALAGCVRITIAPSRAAVAPVAVAAAPPAVVSAAPAAAALEPPPVARAACRGVHATGRRAHAGAEDRFRGSAPPLVKAAAPPTLDLASLEARL